MFKKSKKIIKFLDEYGAAAAEFVAVAPFLLLMLFGIVEFYIAMYSGVVLDISLAAVSRTGKARDVTATEVNLTNELQNRVGGSFDRTKVKTCFVTYGQNWGSFDKNNTNTCGTGATTVRTFGGNQVIGPNLVGAPGDTVVYNATYTWNFVSPLVRLRFPNGQLLLNSSFSVTNNP